MMNTLMVVVVHETDIELVSRLDRGKFVYEVCVETFDSFNRYSAGGTLELAVESFTTRVNMELKKNINKLKKGKQYGQLQGNDNQQNSRAIYR